MRSARKPDSPAQNPIPYSESKFRNRLTTDPMEYRALVSIQIREQFKNGRYHYRLQGTQFTVDECIGLIATVDDAGQGDPCILADFGVPIRTRKVTWRCGVECN